MPIIIPIKELKNTATVSKLCNDNDEPVYVTKNGYGDLVMMSQNCFEEKYDNAFESIIKRAYTERERFLDVATYEKLINEAKTHEEKVFYSGVFNTVLRIKQNEVLENERY